MSKCLVSYIPYHFWIYLLKTAASLRQCKEYKEDTAIVNLIGERDKYSSFEHPHIKKSEWIHLYTDCWEWGRCLVQVSMNKHSLSVVTIIFQLFCLMSPMSLHNWSPMNLVFIFERIRLESCWRGIRTVKQIFTFAQSKESARRTL